VPPAPAQSPAHTSSSTHHATPATPLATATLHLLPATAHFTRILVVIPGRILLQFLSLVFILPLEASVRIAVIFTPPLLASATRFAQLN